MKTRRRCAGCIVALWAALTALHAQPQAPKLVVIIVVDQMRADYIEKFGRQWTAGLRQLVDHGAWFRQAAYPYMNTVTCAGHATISTGAFPATHGMIENGWWDRESGRVVGCTEDPKSPLVSYGTPAAGGNGPSRLLAVTLSDELRVQMPSPPRIVSLSIKERTAVTLAGRRGDAVTWFNDQAHSWVTSTAYANAPVPFVAQFIKAHPVEAEYGKVWTRSLPESAYLYADQAAEERPPRGWTNTFPHPLTSASGAADPEFYEKWVDSPFSSDYLGQLAEASIDALGLGKGRSTDYLAISFSEIDAAGHAFGPRSHEVQDALIKLDAVIGSLLTHLDRAVGPDDYVLALSSDHGVAPIPEQMIREGFDAGRLVTGDVVSRLDKALEPLTGGARAVAQMVYADLYFAPGVMDKLTANPAAMRAAIDAVRSVPGVWRVLRADEVRDRRPTDDPVARAVALSYYPGRSGDLIVVPRPYWFLVNPETPASPSAGTTHGTLHSYDVRVPIVLMGRGIKSGEYTTGTTPADIAPTLAFLCGITLAHPDGRVLSEALTTPVRSGGPTAAGRR
jgi:predicted AlkP superfamily pyrophosphatase or phosphodiesterase